MAFKIALTAGHYMGTQGKRCLKSLDPNETREWVLNDRIADKVEQMLKGYAGYDLIRTDDTTGSKDISLIARTNAANNFKADFYLSIHHNAGVKGGNGGGIVAYIYTSASKESGEWQKDLYNALIDATGLKGNRTNPLAKANLHEVRETNMPAVLLELGFMDSTTDVPVILSEKYAEQCASAIVDVLVKRGGLMKKPEPKPSNSTASKANPAVLAWQKAAIADGYKFPKYGADGVWGAECVAVAQKAIVKKRVVYTHKNLTKIVQKAVGVTADGKCGKNTDAAIKAFQKKHGLKADGQVGLNTWKKILNIR